MYTLYYMDTPFLTYLDLLFLLCYFWSTTTNTICRRASNKQSFQIWLWFQRRWLKCKYLLTTTTTTDPSDDNITHIFVIVLVDFTIHFIVSPIRESEIKIAYSYISWAHHIVINAHSHFRSISVPIVMVKLAYHSLNQETHKILINILFKLELVF